jgi:hypothetical protein
LRELKKISGPCSGGTCPTIYETETGSIVVQGYVVDPSEVGLEMPAGETVVELPRELLERVFKS